MTKHIRRVNKVYIKNKLNKIQNITGDIKMNDIVTEEQLKHLSKDEIIRYYSKLLKYFELSKQNVKDLTEKNLKLVTKINILENRS